MVASWGFWAWSQSIDYPRAPFLHSSYVFFPFFPSVHHHFRQEIRDSLQGSLATGLRNEYPINTQQLKRSQRTLSIYYSYQRRFRLDFSFLFRNKKNWSWKSHLLKYRAGVCSWFHLSLRPYCLHWSGRRFGYGMLPRVFPCLFWNYFCIEKVSYFFPYWDKNTRHWQLKGGEVYSDLCFRILRTCTVVSTVEGPGGEELLRSWKADSRGRRETCSTRWSPQWPASSD